MDERDAFATRCDRGTMSRCGRICRRRCRLAGLDFALRRGPCLGRIFGTAFPVGTFLINITGSLFLGWFLETIRDRMIVSDTVRLAIAVGFVGAYTTFSTFLLRIGCAFGARLGIKAIVNIVGSVVVGLVAVRLGVALARL